MADCSKVEIKTSDNGKMFQEIYIDGHKVNGVRSFELKSAGYGKPPHLILDLNAFNISVDCPVIMYDKDFMENLILFGKMRSNQMKVTPQNARVRTKVCFLLK